ncbi:sperm-tail PG-rich repeat-containing protein 2 [Ochotona princeps]|uniref:sperm-tail PG-rich repeat-containing protein 2 n=1 Tax=Ochotona princeps TaxID=9978 RepID=UPI002714FF94|nr:sperm-tail PG-rich repeat-containing protein 2 [Ochotona princeps]
MYDRAPRLLRSTEGGSTGAHVGPGSYEVPFLKQQGTGGYAPFLSSAARESAFPVALSTEKDGPGPGHYNVSEAQCIIGGHSLQNREERFKKFISDNPGPASYDHCFPETLCRKVLEAKEHLQSKISRARTFTKALDVPSIPSCGQSYGYHINEDDSIRKCVPPASDDTLGPAYYKPLFDVSDATLKYKGVHFGNSSGRRELPTKSGPGPGQYDIVQEKTLYCENINIKKDKQQNYCSSVPRFYEVITLQEEKKGVPGPGKYDIKSQFQKTKSTKPCVNTACPAFLSQSQRFIPVKSVTPAPGTYHEPQIALNSSIKTSRLKKSSFGKNTARFTQGSKAEESPGPGFYNMLNNTILANRKTCLKQPKESAFGSSAPRTFFLVQKEAYTTPGPPDYQTSEVGGISEKLCDLANWCAPFLSRSERTFKIPDMVIPAPGSYDVQKSYEMSQVKHKYMPPRSLMAERRHACFLSAAPRCRVKVAEGPGPASYNPVLKKSCPKAFFVKASKCSEYPKETTPGPATYELSPFLRHSVLKKTFNVTLLCPSNMKKEHILTTEAEHKKKSRRRLK